MKMLTCDLVRALFTFAAFGLAGSPLSGIAGGPGPASSAGPSLIRLPQPRLSGTASVEAALAARRSHRSFSSKPVTLEELSQVLWAAQGTTHPRGRSPGPVAYPEGPPGDRDQRG
jgi:hypothetical protein